MTNKEMTIKIAKEKKVKRISNLIKALNMVDRKQLMYHLRRMRRQGLIVFQVYDSNIKIDLA